MLANQSAVVQTNLSKQLNTQKNEYELQEAALIGKLCKSNEQALEGLYHLYYGRLYRFIARILRRDDFIDEIINDVMYTVWEKAPTYDGQCKPSTWIFGIAFNKARQTLRTENQADNESLDDIDEDSTWLGSYDTGMQQFETDDCLNAALNSLSAEHRAVIELTYYEGMHYSEIANILNCPENTVKTRMHYARKNMAMYLAPLKDSIQLN